MFGSGKSGVFFKVLTGSAIGMTVGFGTCGLLVLTKGGQGQFWSSIAMGGAILFFLSLAVLVVTLVVGLVSLIMGSSRR